MRAKVVKICNIANQNCKEIIFFPITFFIDATKKNQIHICK